MQYGGSRSRPYKVDAEKAGAASADALARQGSGIRVPSVDVVRALSKWLATTPSLGWLAWSGMWPWADHPVFQTVELASPAGSLAADGEPGSRFCRDHLRRSPRVRHTKRCVVGHCQLACRNSLVVDPLDACLRWSSTVAAALAVTAGGASRAYMTAALGYVATRSGHEPPCSDRASSRPHCHRGSLTWAEWLRAKCFTGFPGESYAHLTNWGGYSPSPA